MNELSRIAMRSSPTRFGSAVFVVSLVACLAWDILAVGEDGADSKAPGSKAAPPADDPQTAEVRQFVQRYFRSWSNQEMNAYAEGFMSTATIKYIDGRGNVDSQGAREFLANQRLFQLINKAKEAPLSIDIRFEKRLARVVAYWKLEDGSGTPRYGYDHFTLLKQDGKWKILSLTFYETEEEHP